MANAVGRNASISDAPAGRVTALSSSATAIEPTRTIWCTVAGTADITDIYGNTNAGVAFSVGYHPLSLVVVNNISSATLYALRD
jgi:hypothetical protein